MLEPPRSTSRINWAQTPCQVISGQYRLYRLIANPELPDLGFVGFNSSFCTVLCADMAANWLVRYADGQLAHQPTPVEMRDNLE